MVSVLKLAGSGWKLEAGSCKLHIEIEIETVDTTFTDHLMVAWPFREKTNRTNKVVTFLGVSDSPDAKIYVMYMLGAMGRKRVKQQSDGS